MVLNIPQHWTDGTYGTQFCPRFGTTIGGTVQEVVDKARNPAVHSLKVGHPASVLIVAHEAGVNVPVTSQ